MWNTEAIKAAWSMLQGERSGLWFWGATRRGKTQITQSLARAFIDREMTVAYVSAASLVSDTRPSSDMGRKATAKRQDREQYALTADVLIIDDLGKERRTEAFNQQIYNLVNAAMSGKRRMIVTTNLEPKAIHALYDEAVFSRILTVCGQPIECGGPAWIDGKRKVK
jgi:DNA replication protein DnaC